MDRQWLNQEKIILAFIILIAAILRLIALFNFGTFHFDDLFSVHFASLDLDKMFFFLKNEVHPPAYYLFLHFWIRLFGDSEMIVRIPSLLFSLGSIPLLYYLGKQLLNRFCATFAIILFALSYFQIFIASQARMYSFLTFTGLLSLTLFWLVVAKNQKKLWFFYILVSSLMVLIHLGSLFSLITQYLWLIILVWKKQVAKEKVKKYILSQIPILLVWLIWLIPLFLPKLNTIFSSGWYFSKEMNHHWGIGVYDYFFLLLKNYWLRFASGVIIFTAPFLIILWQDKKIKGKIPGNINPHWFLFSWLLSALAVSIISQINYIRIFTISYLSLYLIVAYFFYLIFKKQKKTWWLIFILWFLISFINLGQNLNQNFSRWDLANDWLLKNQKPDDKIIFTNFVFELPFKRYCPQIKNYEGFYPLVDNKSLEQRIAEKNWQLYINPENIEQLEEMTDDYHRILIIEETYPTKDYFKTIFHNWFSKNNWSVVDVYQPKAFLGPKIIVYSK